MPRYLQGVSLAAFARGNRRMLAPLKASYRDAKTQHDELLAALNERRAKAREIKDPEARAKALEELRGERPTHPTLVAIGCTVVASVVGWPLTHGHHTTVIASALTLWAITALILGQKEPAEKQAGEKDADTSQPTTPTPAETHALTVALAAGSSSVLLTRLATDLAATHPDWEPSTKAVRALLSEAGIPVRQGVRTTDGNGPGIHHQDVPPLPSPTEPAPGAPVVANVGPAQSANTNANNAPPVLPREGFVSVPHPDDPARTIIIHAA